MSYLLSDNDNMTYNKNQNIKKINLLEDNEKEENSGNLKSSSLLNVMNELITTMQQLQKMLIEKHEDANKNNETNIKIIEKTIEKPCHHEPSQTEILLQQVQNAMESTIAQLSSRSPRSPLPCPDLRVEDEPEEKQLTISEKWRLYTEMYQSKQESSKEYCLNKMKLGQELGLSFKETKREMLIGLWSNRLSIVLYLKQHETEEELLKDIDEWEKIESAKSDVFKKYRNKLKN